MEESGRADARPWWRRRLERPPTTHTTTPFSSPPHFSHFHSQSKKSHAEADGEAVHMKKGKKYAAGEA